MHKQSLADKATFMRLCRIFYATDLTFVFMGPLCTALLYQEEALIQTILTASCLDDLAQLDATQIPDREQNARLWMIWMVPLLVASE